MPIEGLDIEQMEGLARQVDSDAQTLYDLVTTLTGVIGGLSLIWRGPVATTFEQDWQSKNRPALLAAHNILTNLHTHLVSNINQQKSASAADTGWTATSSSPAKGSWTAERVVGDFENVLKLEGLASDLNLLGKLEGTPADYVLGPLEVASFGISAWHTANDGYHVANDLVDGHYVKAANDFTDMAADGLKTYPGPVSHGLGVDVTLLHEVANLDWKDTPNPLSGDNFQQYYVPELKAWGTAENWEQAGKTLWGAM